jgi:hypothetical protein
MTSLELGEAAPALPEGFRQERDLFSVVEEKLFCQRFEALPFKPFEFRGYLGNRRVVSFGYRYDYAGRALRKAEPMPDFLEPLKDIVSRFTGIDAAAWQQAELSRPPAQVLVGTAINRCLLKWPLYLSLSRVSYGYAEKKAHRDTQVRLDPSTIGLSAIRICSRRMATQHRADEGTALLGYISLVSGQCSSRITEAISLASP